LGSGLSFACLLVEGRGSFLDLSDLPDRRMMTDTEYGVTPHVLRHTFATLALQKGLSLAAVKKILGHDRLSTTEIYLNLTDGHVLEEYERKW